jgi:hypothetical protein
LGNAPNAETPFFNYYTILSKSGHKGIHQQPGVLPENWSSSYERITDNFGMVFAFRKGTSHEETRADHPTNKQAKISISETRKYQLRIGQGE